MAASFQSLENKQKRFITVMEALGYRSDRDGICHGISHMCIPAYLVGDREEFHNRLYMIQKIFFDALKRAKSKLVTIPEEKFSNEKEREQFIKQMLEKLLKEEINSIFNTLSIELQIDIKAFFDGVEVYHLSHCFTHLFPTGTEKPSPQDAEPTHALVESKKLREEKGIKLFGEFGDGFFQACSVKEVAQSFENMRLSFLSTSSTQPIALALPSLISNHVISVIYYPHTQTWILVDPSNLLREEKEAIKETKDPHEIAQQVVSALSPSGRKAAFSTKIYGTGNSKSIYHLPTQQWKERQELQLRRKDILEIKAEADTPRILAIQALQKFAVTISSVKELLKKQDQLTSIDACLEQCGVLGEIYPESREKIAMLKNKINHAYKFYASSFDSDRNGTQVEKLIRNIQNEIGQLISRAPIPSRCGFFKCCKKSSPKTQQSSQSGILQELKEGYTLIVKDIGFFHLTSSLCREMITRAGLKFRK